MEGGVAHAGLGSLQDLQKFELGIATFRAAWLAVWTADKLDMEQLLALGMTEVLGRLSFASMPLDFIRSFLGSLYAWVSAAPPYAILKQDTSDDTSHLHVSAIGVPRAKPL